MSAEVMCPVCLGSGGGAPDEVQFDCSACNGYGRVTAESQLDAFADALADLCAAVGALQAQHAEQYEALRAEMQGDVTLLREALEEIAGTYDDGTPAQIIAEDALAALGEP